MLERVVYVSRAVLQLTDAELEALLAKSRKLNDQAGITGVLFYKNDSFLQVLEGERAGLHALLSRIKRDPLHTRMRVISSAPITSRLFDSWQMGFANLNGWSGPAPEGFQDYFAVEFDFSVESNSTDRLCEFARRFPDFAPG